MENLFLGIDESNHGRFPEIYTATCSSDLEKIKIYDNANLEKIRCLKDIGTILDKTNFKYIVIEKVYKESFGIRGTKIIVLTEFFNAFKNVHTAYVDGELIDSVKTGVRDILGKNNTPNIADIIRGDKKIELINMADRIAYYLFRNYTGNTAATKEIRNKYLKNLITPNLAQYANILLTS